MKAVYAPIKWPESTDTPLRKCPKCDYVYEDNGQGCPGCGELDDTWDKAAMMVADSLVRGDYSENY